MILSSRALKGVVRIYARVGIEINWWYQDEDDDNDDDDLVLKIARTYLPVSFQRQPVDTPPVRLGSVWTRSGANCFRLGLAVVLLTRTCPQRPSREKDMTSFWRRRHVLMMAWYFTTRTQFFLRQRTLKLPDLWGFMNRQRPDSQT